MEITGFLTLVVPFILVFYIAVILFIHAPRQVLQASLLGGLVMALINMLGDLAAYYFHWWHYSLNGLILHLPIPFYITPFLIYGSLGYLLIWRFWRASTASTMSGPSQRRDKHWLALLFLIGIPLFGIVRDLSGWLTNSAYSVPDSWLAWPLDAVLWVVMFYAGYALFRRLAPPREAFEQKSVGT